MAEASSNMQKCDPLQIRTIKLEQPKEEEHKSPLSCTSEENVRLAITQIIKIEDNRSETIKNEPVRFKGKVKYLQIRPVPITNNKKFTCDICKKGVGTKGGLIYHMKAHINGRAFKCDICQRSYATKNDFDTHFKRHAGISYKCDLCGKSYRVKQYLADHVRVVHFPKVIPCSHCKKHFATEKLLKYHMEYRHMKLKSLRLYACKLCGVKFGKKAYKLHCEEREILRFECVICAKKFPCYKLMVEHRKQEDRANFCKICQIKVTSIINHMFKYHKTRICNLCKTFKTENSNLFASHRKKCGSKEKLAMLGHSCTECNKKFDSTFKLNKHLNNAHGKFRCQICFNVFFTEESLKTHYNYHKRYKHEHIISLYRCILCPEPKNFTLKKYFDLHFHKRHSTSNLIFDGCKKYAGGLVCDKCRHRSSTQRKLYLHILKCYNIKPPRHNQQRKINFGRTSKPIVSSQGGSKISVPLHTVSYKAKVKDKITKGPGPVRSKSKSAPDKSFIEVRHLRNRKVAGTANCD